MLALSSNATRARVRVRVGGQSSSSSSSRVVLRRRSASNHLRLQRLTTTVTRAEDPKKEDVGGAEADEFLGGAMGKFISGLTEFAANSPINQGKILLAKAQAGHYDEDATRAELQSIIDGSKVVMFSFTP